MVPAGARHAVELLQAHAPKNAHVLEVDDGTAPLAPSLARLGHAVTQTRPGPALAAPQTADVVILLRPTRFGALIPLLQQARAALVDEGLAIVSDVVWQTAPTPELMRAFTPVGGGEKVRPIEGWEMQAEHAGFDIVERRDVDVSELRALFADDGGRSAALAADARGAAKLAVWALRRA